MKYFRESWAGERENKAKKKKKKKKVHQIKSTPGLLADTSAKATPQKRAEGGGGAGDKIRLSRYVWVRALSLSGLPHKKPCCASVSTLARSF